MCKNANSHRKINTDSCILNRDICISNRDISIYALIQISLLEIDIELFLDSRIKLIQLRSFHHFEQNPVFFFGDGE